MNKTLPNGYTFTLMGCFFGLETSLLSQTILQLENISKSFDGPQVLKGISLAVDKGEFVTILGPSGCGKTTILRIVAGLETPDSGRVFLEGRDVTDLPPNHRDLHTVFQNYALFPHMNVYQNITYSLKLRHLDKGEIKTRAREMLELIQLQEYGRRRPQELSGGQRQRVAIARGLISRPSLLLLDEPLGALDLQLRRQMQQELRRMQRSMGISFIYITHDQEEAINMSDRIVVMNEGRLEQSGTPTEIYDHPKTSFVAGFVGTANILQGIVLEINGETAQLELPDGAKVLVETVPGLSVGESCNFSVRAENTLVSGTQREGFTLSGRMVENSYTGGVLRLVVDAGQERELLSSRSAKRLSDESAVFVSWEPTAAVVLDREVPK